MDSYIIERKMSSFIAATAIINYVTGLLGENFDEKAGIIESFPRKIVKFV